MEYEEAYIFLNGVTIAHWYPREGLKLEMSPEEEFFLIFFFVFGFYGFGVVVGFFLEVVKNWLWSNQLKVEVLNVVFIRWYVEDFLISEVFRCITD